MEHHRSARASIVATALILVLGTSSAALPRIELGLPIGPSGAFVESMATAPGLLCRGGEGAPPEWASVVSPRAIGAIGGMGHPALCAAPAMPTTESVAGIQSTLAAGGDSGRLSLPAELEVVRARIGVRGQVILTDRSGTNVDTEVLRVVARELAYPRVLTTGTAIRAVYDVATAARPHLFALRIGKGTAAKVAFYFRSQTSLAEGFFARDGRGLEHRLLRYPVAFNYISSGFADLRLHPILGGFHPHNGVDFAAKPGTPVLAAGAGTVVEAAWDGRFGRTIRIRHEGGLVSGYAHLEAFAAGVRRGASVRKGQVIGYVGASGLATGPHLHFSITRNGRYVDPLGPSLPKRASLSAGAMVEFQRVVAGVDRALQEADVRDTTPTLLARTTGPSQVTTR